VWLDLSVLVALGKDYKPRLFSHEVSDVTLHALIRHQALSATFVSVFQLVSGTSKIHKLALRANSKMCYLNAFIFFNFTILIGEIYLKKAWITTQACIIV
jgi:hypothetical protein